MKKCKIGIIGLGNMGMNHVRVYMNIPDVEVVSLCDLSESMRISAAKVCGSAVLYSDYKEMLKKEKLDGVSIVVPTKFHKEVALEAINVGVNILLEKPVAQNSQEALDITEQVKEKGVKCLIGHIERFNPAVEVMKQKLQECIGEVYSVRVTRVGTAPIGSVENDVIMELAVHDIDVIMYLFDTNIKRVYALRKSKIVTNFNDVTFAILELENGVIVSLDVNWISPIKKREIIITGEKGMFHLNYIPQDLCYYKPPQEGNIYTKDMLFKRKEGEVVKFEIDKKEPLAVEIEHFIDCIIDNAEPRVSAEDGLSVLKVAEEINKAAKLSEVVVNL